MTPKKAAGRASDLEAAARLGDVHCPTNSQVVAQTRVDFQPVFSTPRDAVHAMIDRGARLRILRRDDALQPGFIFEMMPGSTPNDLAKVRAIIRFIKDRPPAFYQAFLAAVMASEQEGQA